MGLQASTSHHLCESNYKYLIQRGIHLTFAQIPPHSHLWMARRGASPRHFHGDTVWWTAGPPPRSKLFTWFCSESTSEPLQIFFLWFLLICDWSRLTPEIKYFEEINKDIDPEWLSIISVSCDGFHPPSLIICGAGNARGEGCMKPCCWICCQLQLQRPFRLCPLVIDLQINEEKYLVKCQYM